jgi:hypothetical protein
MGGPIVIIKWEINQSKRYRLWENTGVQKFRGLKLHSRSWNAFGMHIYEKRVGFVRPSPKFGANLVITWGNEYF